MRRVVVMPISNADKEEKEEAPGLGQSRSGTDERPEAESRKQQGKDTERGGKINHGGMMVRLMNR